MISEKPICVTGASGFIASHVIKQLLEKGYEVKGTVRSLKDRSRYSFLDELPNAEKNLELIEAELLKEGSYDGAIKDCEYVIHMASPYIVDVNNPQTDLVDPAVNGTLNVFKSCSKEPRVKRIILTSSFAAVTDQPIKGKIFNEFDWNTKSSLDRNPYYFSKTLAERAAWDYIKEHKPDFDLVCINPYMVVGASLIPSLNTSNKILLDLLTGGFPGIINLNWGFVDVRDVAKSHILAMENSSAKGRHLCINESLTLKQLVSMFENNGYQNYKLPKLDLRTKMGDVIVYLASYLQPKGTGSFLRTNIGKTMLYDNSKIKKELGIDFLPMEESILEATKDLIYWGHLKN